MTEVYIQKSKAKDKRLMAKFPNKTIYERTAPSRHRAYVISSMEDLPSLEFGNFNFGDSTQ